MDILINRASGAALVKSPWAARVCLVVLGLVSLLGTAQIQLTVDSEAVRFVNLVAFAGVAGLAPAVWLPREFRITVFIALSTFTMVWGTSIFRSYVYYDEIGRVTHSSLDPTTWLQPVNDHFQPLMSPVWWAQYNQIFGGSYLPISISMYLFAFLGILCIFYVACILNMSSGITGALLVALVAAVPLHNPDLWWWKGAGDAPVISLALMFAWLAILVRYGSDGGLFAQIAATGCAIGAVFASSSVTLIFVYALPLLIIPRYRTPRFYFSLVAATFISLTYWFMRVFIVDIGVEEYAYSIVQLPGALASIWIEFGYNNPVLIVLFGLMGLISLWSFRHATPELKAFIILALLIIALGGLQLWAARGMTLNTSHDYSGYHMYLPFLGCSLLVGLGLQQSASKIKIQRQTLSVTGVLYIAVGIMSILFMRESGFTQGVPVTDTLKIRRNFFGDIRALGPAVIPDINLALSPTRSVLHFMPQAFLDNPVGGVRYGWVDRMNLSLLRPMTGGTYSTEPCRSEAEYDPSVLEFITKYWGPGDPCSFYLPPDG